jgi:hypothetical protein
MLTGKKILSRSNTAIFLVHLKKNLYVIEQINGTIDGAYLSTLE